MSVCLRDEAQTCANAPMPPWRQAGEPSYCKGQELESGAGEHTLSGRHMAAGVGTASVTSAPRQQVGSGESGKSCPLSSLQCSCWGRSRGRTPTLGAKDLNPSPLGSQWCLRGCWVFQRLPLGTRPLCQDGTEKLNNRKLSLQEWKRGPREVQRLRLRGG